VVGSLVPVIPFAVVGIRAASWLSVAVAALTLFVVGAYKAKVTIGRPLKSGLDLAAIGTLSALAGYAVGVLFKVPSAH
jgi:predicted membrane protein (TIGR00267 family)